jgi:phage-related protein
LKNGFTNALNFIRNSVSTIGNKVRELMNSMINTLRELPSKVIEIGRNLVAGLWNGISDKIQWVKDRIYSMGSQIISAIKGVFGIASPSKVFAGIGEYLAEGLGVGFDDGMSDVKKDIVGSMDNLTGNMTATVSAYGNAAQTLGSTTNYNGGTITINVYGAEGQNVNELAEKVANKLGEMTQRRGAIYA